MSGNYKPIKHFDPDKAPERPEYFLTYVEHCCRRSGWVQGAINHFTYWVSSFPTRQEQIDAVMTEVQQEDGDEK